MYGSELWFNHSSSDIEIVHNKFYKYVLSLTVQDPNCFVRSELGKHSLSPYKYIRAITNWLRILNLPNDVPNEFVILACGLMYQRNKLLNCKTIFMLSFTNYD